MITVHSLSSLTAKDLGAQARQQGVSGWHSMKKQELVKVLLKIARQKERESNGRSSQTSPKVAPSRPENHLGLSSTRKNGGRTAETTAKHKTSETAQIRNRPDNVPNRNAAESDIAVQLRLERERAENLKNLALISLSDREQKIPDTDRLIVVVRDSFWLQVYWEVTKATVERAKVALEAQWHSAKPVLRVLEVQSEGNTNSIESLAEEIPIHGGVKNWFLHLRQPGRQYRVAIGYTVADGRFFLICKSNLVCSPATNSHATDENWTDLTNDVEKYYALSGGYDENIQSGDLQAIFEEKSRHPIHAPAFERLGSGINGHSSEFMFQVDAHVIIFGKTIPNGSVMVAGEPVRLQKDGTFSVKIDLPDRRQVLPIVASSRDGTQQRTTVLAIERNTKVMEPLTNDFED